MNRAVIILFFGISLGLCSQQTVLLNQSQFNLFTLNPSSIGLEDQTRANLHYKKSLINIPDGPELFQLTMDGALKNRNYALGANIISQKAGLFEAYSALGAFRYKARLTKMHHLHFGVSAGFNKQSVDFSRIIADKPEEFALFPQQSTVTKPEVNAGISYNNRNLITGVSMLNIIPGKYTFSEPVNNQSAYYAIIPLYNAFIQYSFYSGNKRTKLIPHLSLRSMQGMPLQAEIAVIIHYDEKVLMGMGYRNDYSFYANAGIVFNRNLRFVYSYEHNLRINTVSKGGHEIGLAFWISNRTGGEKAAGGDGALDEIFEKIDSQEEKMDKLTVRNDSLDKRVANLSSEVERLKNHQMSKEEIIKAIDAYFDTQSIIKKSEPAKRRDSLSGKNEQSKYQVINPKLIEEYVHSDTSRSDFKIVLGVYQIKRYAEDYQRLLKEHEYSTYLHILPDHPKKFIYVCAVNELDEIQMALKELRRIRSSIKASHPGITKGEPWILQTRIYK